ncbi:ATP-binding protein [Streptomyces smyrnaeus]|uniref:ATP-binding protein n=1 Tax=Streptomyces smyrnaeus TaxID=1387713 RepID=UPI0036A642FC
MPHPDSTPRLRFRLPATKPHVGAARERVRDAVKDWGIDKDLSASLIQVVSELATNAVIHCQVTEALFQVNVYQVNGSFFLEVSDPDGDHSPKLRNATDEEENGRGLFLVDLLATEWGTRPGRTVGKTVWARFDSMEEVAA